MDSGKKWYQKLDAWLTRFEEISLFVLVALLVLVTFLQVVLRNLPGNPSLPWIDILARLMVLWIGLLGASIAVVRKKHITIDAISRFFGEKGMRIINGINLGTSLAALLVLYHGALVFTMAKHVDGLLPIFRIESVNWAVQERIFTDPMPLLFLFMVWHVWVQWKDAISKKSSIGAVIGYVGGALTAGILLAVTLVDLSLVNPVETLASLDTIGHAIFDFNPLIWFAFFGGIALLGAPLFVVIAGIALLGHYGVESIPVANFITDGYGGFRKSTIFLAIPLFTLAGYLMAEGGTPQRLVNLFRGWLGWLPGGIAIVALVACSFFTAFTGASGVTIIALGGLLYPILRQEGYPEKFTLGLLTTGGSRGLIFPPATPVFLMAMIMGLSWDAVSASGLFGEAAKPSREQAQICLKERQAKQDNFKAEMSGRRAEEAAIQAAIQAAMKTDEPASVRTPGGDEFDMGMDDSIDAVNSGGSEDREPGDEFDLGEDEAIAPVAPAEPEEPADEFDLGEDEAILAVTPESGGDEFDLGEDEAIAPGADRESGGAVVAGLDEDVQVDDVIKDPAAEGGIAVPSSSQIFTAGLIPGILSLLAIAVFSIIMGFKFKVNRTPFRIRTAGKAVLAARWEIPIPIIIVIGIFGGYFTPAEAASATAFYVLVMQLLLYRDLGFQALVRSFVDSMVLVGGILIILIAAMGMLNFLVIAKVPDAILAFMENVIPERLELLGLVTIPRQILFLLMLNIFLLIVGCLMDIFSAILIVLPLLLPLAYRFGVHPAHLAVIFLTNLEIGYSTPPVGMNLFVASLRFDKPIVKLYSASLAYLGIMLCGLMLITYWPDLSLWLVNLTGIQ